MTPSHFLCGASFPQGWGGGGGGERDTPEAPFLQESKLRLIPPPPPNTEREGFGRVTHRSQRTGTLPPLLPPSAHTQKEGRRLQRLPPALFISLTAGTARHPHRLPRQNPRDTHEEPALRRGRPSPGFSSRALPRRPGVEWGEIFEKSEGRGWPSPRFPGPKTGLFVGAKRLAVRVRVREGQEKAQRQPAKGARVKSPGPGDLRHRNILLIVAEDQDVPTGRPRDVRSPGRGGDGGGETRPGGTSSIQYASIFRMCGLISLCTHWK